MDRVDIRTMYVIYDKIAAEVCSPVFVAVNDDVAKRSFVGYLSGNPNTPDPSDYRLIAIGHIDMVAGLVLNGETAEFIMDGIDIKKEDK